MVVETTKLIGAIKKMYPVAQFFKDRYFPDGQVFYSEKALIEMKKGGRRVAPFVVPVVNGIVMDAEGYKAEEVRAPYIAPKMPITPDDLAKKAFGESPESGRSPAQRENEIEAEHMDDLRKAILRRHELMCTDIITTGQTTMKHYATADDAAKDKNAKVLQLRYFDAKFENTYEFEKDFATMPAKEKILEFYKIAQILKKRGVAASDIVMTGDVSMLLMTDMDFLKYYDVNKVNMGAIDQKTLPNGVTYNGSININGIIFNMFTYDEYYEDLDGEVKPFLPSGTIAFLQPGMGKTAYAQVTFVKGSGFVSYAQKIVPRVVADESNNLMEVQVFSRPVPYPLDMDGWMVANIHDYKGKATKDTDGASAESLSEDGTGVTLKTAEEINAMTTKAAVIAYGESIGMTGLSSTSSLTELKEAVIAYQESN